jgi:paraquat-inducible protein B
VRFLEVNFFNPQRYPPPALPFSPAWNYIPAAPSTLRSLEEAALEFANRLPTLGEQTSVVLLEGRETLGSVRKLSDELQGEQGHLMRLLARLETAASTLETAVRDSQIGLTTSALRTASTSVTGAADGINTGVVHVTTGVIDVTDELRTDLVGLRETLDSIRALVESLDRDPSVLIRGRRADGAAPGKTK